MPLGFGLMSRVVLGISRPRQPILGTELAGEVESTGKAVSKFQPVTRCLRFLVPVWVVMRSTNACRKTARSR
jgi:NADPH:quinone reductase-like Zn-dependent oxidoreductase